MKYKNTWVGYTDEQLLDAIREAPRPTYDALRYSYPSSRTISNRFGSWPKALDAAGIPRNTQGPQHDKPATFYVVDFGDFQKFGITQRSIKERFIGYPACEVIFTQEFPTLIAAWEEENKWKEAVWEYRYTPTHYRFFHSGGSSECFKILGTTKA